MHGLANPRVLVLPVNDTGSQVFMNKELQQLSISDFWTCWQNIYAFLILQLSVKDTLPLNHFAQQFDLIVCVRRRGGGGGPFQNDTDLE